MWDSLSTSLLRPLTAELLLQALLGLPGMPDLALPLWQKLAEQVLPVPHTSAPASRGGRSC